MNASTSDPTLTGSAYPDVNELSRGTGPGGTGPGGTSGLSGGGAGLGSSGLSGGSAGLSGSGSSGSGAGLSGGADSMSESKLSGVSASIPPAGSTTGGDTSTLDRVVQGAHDALDRAAERARPAVDKLRGTLGGSGESLLGDRAEEWKAMQEQYLTQFRGFVRDHPVATVAGALAVGMLLSRMMDDR